MPGASSIVTQSTSPPLVIVQGAYRWFFGQGDRVEISPGEGGVEWIETSARQDTPQEQYELNLDTCVAPETLFRQLVDQWRQERGASSSTTEILLCPSYQSIIGMGEQAIPLILAEMESEGDDPDQWFWALQALTRVNPVAEEDEGNLWKMAQTWISWARKRYIW
jgi:hypothetical protein